MLIYLIFKSCSQVILLFLVAEKIARAEIIVWFCFQREEERIGKMETDKETTGNSIVRGIGKYQKHLKPGFEHLVIWFPKATVYQYTTNLYYFLAEVALFPKVSQPVCNRVDILIPSIYNSTVLRLYHAFSKTKP